MNEMDLHEPQLVETCSAANKGQTRYREVTWNVKGFKKNIVPLEAEISQRCTEPKVG